MKKSIGAFLATISISVFIFFLLMLYACDGIISSPNPHKTWNSPVTLCAGYYYAWNPKQISFSCNNAGTAFVAWEQFNGLRISIWAQSYNTASAWSPGSISIDSDIMPNTNIDLNTDNSSLPRICIDSSGNAIAVWSQYDGSTHRVWSNRYNNADKEWGESVCIDQMDSSSILDIQTAMDGRGNCIAVWIRDNGSERELWFNRYLVGSGWGTAGLVDTGHWNDSYVHMGMDQSGNALCVWRDNQSGDDRISAIRYTPDTGWDTPLFIDQNTGAVYSPPQIASDNSGNAIAVWTQREDDGDGMPHIWANRYNADTGWETAVPLEQAPNFAYYPVVAVDGSGNAIALWEQKENSHLSLWAAHYIPETGWTTPFVLENSSEGVSEPCIAFNSRGDAVAAWTQNDGANKKVYVNHYTTGGEWTGAECISEGIFGHMRFPSIAIDDEGNAVAVWYQSGDSYYILWTNVFK